MVETTSGASATEALHEPAAEPLRGVAIAAVRLNEIQIAARDNWCLLIRDGVAPLFYRHFSDSEACRDLAILLDFENFAAISEIWRSSDFIKDSEFERAEAGRKPRKLTRQSLSRRMQTMATRAGEIADVSTFEGRAARLVKAMIAHRLVSEDLGRPNYIPIRGTDTLNHLMESYHADLEARWRAAMFGSEAPVRVVNEEVGQ